MKRHILILIFSILNYLSSYAQNNEGVFSISYSIGINLNTNNQFYGYAIDYSKSIKNSPWFVGTTLMWDEEKANTKEISTYSMALSIGYKINNRWSVGTGLGKGLINNDNEKQLYKLIGEEWSTGINFTYSFILFRNCQFSMTNAVEYNISQKEYSFSIDLNYTIKW